jgi:hypothetical protein
LARPPSSSSTEQALLTKSHGDGGFVVEGNRLAVGVQEALLRPAEPCNSRCDAPHVEAVFILRHGQQAIEQALPTYAVSAWSIAELRDQLRANPSPTAGQFRSLQDWRPLSSALRPGPFRDPIRLRERQGSTRGGSESTAQPRASSPQHTSPSATAGRNSPRRMPAPWWNTPGLGSKMPRGRDSGGGSAISSRRHPRA